MDIDMKFDTENLDPYTITLICLAQTTRDGNVHSGD